MSLADLPYSVAGLTPLPTSNLSISRHSVDFTNLLPKYPRPPRCRNADLDSCRASFPRYDCVSKFLGESDILGAGCGTVHLADAGFSVHHLTPNLLPATQPEREHVRVSAFPHRMVLIKRIFASCLGPRERRGWARHGVVWCGEVGCVSRSARHAPHTSALHLRCSRRCEHHKCCQLSRIA